MAGGPKSNFVYTTVGDTGHSSQYEIDTTADCSAAGADPSPAGGGAAEGGGETGWILIGLLLGCSAVYFGGFYVYNWKVKGAEPSERMPHKEFWAGLPDLIKVMNAPLTDTCAFVLMLTFISPLSPESSSSSSFPSAQLTHSRIRIAQ